jgi:hypothetical protein
MSDRQTLALSVIACATLTLSSCASSEPTIRTIAAECNDLKAINYYWRDECSAYDPSNLCDSEATVAQIQAYNAYRNALCQEDDA